jgi:hypothetical protein
VGQRRLPAGFRSTLQYVPRGPGRRGPRQHLLRRSRDLAELLTRSVRRERDVRAQRPASSPATTIPVS